IVGAREVMEEPVSPIQFDPDQWSSVGFTALRANDAAEMAGRLSQARRPLLVTSYFGRRPGEVPGLVKLCRRIGMGVLESVPSCVNYPNDDELYRGNQWNEPRQNPALAEADVILVMPRATTRGLQGLRRARPRTARSSRRNSSPPVSAASSGMTGSSST